MIYLYRTIAIAGAAAMLGGCQGSPLTSWMFKSPGNAHSLSQPLAMTSASSLEQGRNYLRRGSIAAAVASFQLARLDPSNRAEANNGLAVAYATSGRFDIAERYFRAAAAIEPANPKFAANLLRLQQQQYFARQEQEQQVTLAALDRPRVRRPADANRTSGPVERVSRNEVLVRSQPSSSEPPSMTVMARATVNVAPSVPSDNDASEAGLDQIAQQQPLTVYFGK